MIYTPLTKKALKLCFDAHKDQTDKSGLPYVFHPFHLAEQMDDEIGTCTALLHDVVEDTPLTLNDLKNQGFPDEVLEALALLTHSDVMDYTEYVRIIKGSKTAKKVKLADLAHNSDLTRFDSIGEEELARVNKYKKAVELLNAPDTPLTEILHDTLACCKIGSYRKDGKKIKLPTDYEDMKQAVVFLPDKADTAFSAPAEPFGEVCDVSCSTLDTYAAAIKIKKEEPDCRLLVLNFANPVNVGGGVKKGARAQEEDLCRRSSLLLSIDSGNALPYYEYNRGLHTYMGSDALILSPCVDIFKDERGGYLDEPVTAAVLTCAAPCITYGTEGLTLNRYRDMLYRRIIIMLRCAVHYGYTHFVLGAWGCGAFGNDAKLISDLFAAALQDSFDGFPFNRLFKRIEFAVLDRRGGAGYNYNEFKRNFP